MNELCNRNAQSCALQSNGFWIKRGEKDWLSGLLLSTQWNDCRSYNENNRGFAPSRGLCSNGNYASVSKLVLHQNKKKILFEWLSTRIRFKTEGRRNLVNTWNICWVALLLVRRYARVAGWTVRAKLRCTCTRLLLNAHMHAQKLFFNSQNKFFFTVGLDRACDGWKLMPASVSLSCSFRA